MSHRLRIPFYTSLLCIFALLVVAAFATTREIDKEKTVSTEQIKLGQALPRTLVIRVKAGTRQAEVLHLKTALKADEKSRQLISSSSFMKLDSKGKMVGELDRDSSSSSWGFRGWGYPGYGHGGYPGYGHGYYGGYGYGGYGRGYYGGYGYPGYGYGYGYGGYPYYASYGYPYYSYCGYSYAYVPYYSYYNSGYYYNYYGWPYSNPYCAY